jgi:hypothetical protein
MCNVAIAAMYMQLNDFIPKVGALTRFSNAYGNVQIIAHKLSSKFSFSQGLLCVICLNNTKQIQRRVIQTSPNSLLPKLIF